MAFWTEARTELATQLWKDGQSATQIAARLGGCTRNAVIGRIHRLGLAGRPKTRTRIYGAPAKGGRPKKSFASTAFVMSPVQKAMAKIRTEPIPSPAATDVARVSFNDVEPHHCRFIPGDPAEFRADRPMYCGDKIVPGMSWCPAHATRCTNPMPPLRSHHAPPDRVRNNTKEFA